MTLRLASDLIILHILFVSSAGAQSKIIIAALIIPLLSVLVESVYERLSAFSCPAVL